MNWNYWLPWREYPEDSKDSTYETKVIERCDHDFEQTTEIIGPDLGKATIEDGYLVVPVKELVQEFCEKCGKPGYQGEANPYEEYDYAYSMDFYDGNWSRTSHKLAFEPAFEIEPGRSVADVPEKVGEDSPDPGRVLVNESDQDYDVTD